MPLDITEREPLQHLLMGMYETAEDGTDISVAAERIVEITDLSAHAFGEVPQLVIKYGRTRRGLVAQLQDRYREGEDYGTEVHFFPEETGIAGLVTDDVFLRRAQMLGCDSLQLAETIFDYIPEPQV